MVSVSRDEHILVKSGKDAVQYLTFQRYLICYMALVTLFSIAIILPINFQGDLGNKCYCGVINIITHCKVPLKNYNVNMECPLRLLRILDI